jgi:hypothetical protein
VTAIPQNDTSAKSLGRVASSIVAGVDEGTVTGVSLMDELSVQAQVRFYIRAFLVKSVQRTNSGTLPKSEILMLAGSSVSGL